MLETFVKLNDHLETYPYLGGYFPCKEEFSFHVKIKSEEFDSNCYPHLQRWINHLNSFSNSSQFHSIDIPYNKMDSNICDLLESKVNIEDQSRTMSNVPPSICKKKEASSTKKKTKLVLKTPKGSTDYHPSQMVVRRKVFEVLIEVFRMHGAEEIETPVFELKDVLTGKYGEDSKLIYDLQDQGGEILSLRYDLTVPFARYVAMNKIMNMKRYHIARVYRRDNPAMTRGRFREFYQCDFDIAGVYDLMVPDAECIQLAHQVLQQLQLGDFTIKVNHRKILDGLFGACGVPPEMFRSICSAVDKLDKSPWAEVKKEMVVDKGLDEQIADLIGQYVKLSGREDLIDTLTNDPLLSQSADVKQGLSEMKLLFELCACLNCDTNLLFDMGLARGLDYYTGVIYEATLSDAKFKDGPVGSVVGGGRYDNLVGMFDPKDKTVPCVGISFGIERLFAIMERKAKDNNVKLRSTHTQVYVISAGKGLLMERLRLVALLHEAGIYAETSFKNNARLLAQLTHAETTCIPVLALLGDSEVADGVVKVQLTSDRSNKETRDIEQTVPRATVVQHIVSLLDKMPNRGK